jgi:hypothetical protein
MTRMFIVALISAIVSAPFALSVQYLIVNVLSKQTMSQEEEKKEKEREISLASKLWRSLCTRKTSIEPYVFNSSDLEESCGTSTQDDLNHLLQEVSGYYKYLQEKNRERAKEFRSESFLPCPPYFPSSHSLILSPCLSFLSHSSLSDSLSISVYLSLYPFFARCAQFFGDRL